MASKKDRQRFEQLMLVHLDAAYNLALWLLRDAAEAEDVVQIAYMKAFEHFASFQGGNAAGWILTIVRNTAFNVLQKAKRSSNLISFEEAAHGHASLHEPSFQDMNPEETLSALATGAQIMSAIERLPVEYREVFFLREIEDYSYKEIAEITQVPEGTVMSRLSRARSQMQKMLAEDSRRKMNHVM